MECEYCTIFKNLEKNKLGIASKEWTLQESPTENCTHTKLFSVEKHGTHNVMEILLESKQELIWCQLKEGDTYVIVTETSQVPDEHVQLVREPRISHLLLNVLCNMENGILQEVK